MAGADTPTTRHPSQLLALAIGAAAGLAIALWPARRTVARGGAASRRA